MLWTGSPEKWDSAFPGRPQKTDAAFLELICKSAAARFGAALNIRKDGEYERFAE